MIDDDFAKIDGGKVEDFSPAFALCRESLAWGLVAQARKKS